MQPNAALAFRPIQGFRPALHCGLCCAIGRRARCGDKCSDRRHHGNPPAQPIGAWGLRGHDLKRGERRVQDAGDIDLKNLSCLGCRFRDPASAGANAGIGNHQIKLPGASDPARHGRRITNIQHTGPHLSPARAAGAGGFFQPCGVAAREMQHHARRGAGLRQGAAQAG